jgi:hypothetical protein
LHKAADHPFDRSATSSQQSGLRHCNHVLDNLALHFLTCSNIEYLGLSNQHKLDLAIQWLKAPGDA